MTATDPNQQPDPDYTEKSYGKLLAFALCVIFSLCGLVAIAGLLFLFMDDLPI